MLSASWMKGGVLSVCGLAREQLGRRTFLTDVSPCAASRYLPPSVALNKADLLPSVSDTVTDVQRRLEQTIAEAHGVALVPISALEGTGVDELMPAVCVPTPRVPLTPTQPLRSHLVTWWGAGRVSIANYEAWNTRVSTGRLNRSGDRSGAGRDTRGEGAAFTTTGCPRVACRFLAALTRHHPPPAAYKTIYRRLPGRTKSVPVQVPLKIKTLMQVRRVGRTGRALPRARVAPSSNQRVVVAAAAGEHKATHIRAVRKPVRDSSRLARGLPLRPGKSAAHPSTHPPLLPRRTDVPEAYCRFLLGAIRAEFGFQGVPMRLMIRTSSNPFKQG